ncbi:MAG: LynF/TruF/PatF family peptide O-prenyltransferase [Hormoscilla sp. GM7CHS1pb]|nr:LynF/TruF/PatF family peptide O-prenyltransferase [Hormoscilla sp. GM7CHS1pb]
MTQHLLDLDKNIRYLEAHQQAFQIPDIYPLELFKHLVEKAGGYTIECSCKIAGDQLDPARFNLWFRDRQYFPQEINGVLEFFRAVEAMDRAKLDYSLFQKFYSDPFDWSKVKKIAAGVDLRPEKANYRLKIWFIIEDYPEKLEAAISLHGEREDVRTLIVNNKLLIGFDFFLDGHSTIKLYPEIDSKEWQQVDVQQRLRKVLSPQALQLLDACDELTVAFSKGYEDKILHLDLLDANNFIHKLGHEMASKVHAHYQGKQVERIHVSLSERELLAGSIENLNMYYLMP